MEKKLVIIIEVIRTNRAENWAYIAISDAGPLDYIAWPDGWGNRVLMLDKLEEYAHCKFDDGEHPYITFHVEVDNPLLQWFIA